jgi:leucyl aminopeptidase (aminopeptidase T)
MAWPEKENIRRGVASMLQVNLAVQDGEKVLIMTDPPPLKQWRELGLEWLQEALERCALARMVADFAAELVPGSEITFLPYPAVERSGAEPDLETAERMQASDVIIAITNYSLTHTMAAQAASEAGARIASMPGFLPEMFAGPMTADYHRIAEDSKKIAGLLTEAKTAVITTSAGTQLTLNLKGRSGDVDTGLITPGRIDNLPAGEAFIAPLEGTAEGKVVVSPKGYAPLEEPMTIHFKAGEVCDIEGGGEVGEEFRRLLELPTPGRQTARRNLAELGIGTNAKARSVQSTLEAEKIKGTVHIAIGDSAHIGGVVSADLHQDFVFWEPDLSLDGRVVIRRGKWLV